MKRPHDTEAALDRLIAEGGKPLERLRAMIDESDASGLRETFDIEQFLKEARKRHATKGNASTRKPPSIFADEDI